MSLVVSLLLVLLVALGAGLFAQYGIWMCEEKSMLKQMLIGFFAVYGVAAIGLKLLLPVVPSNNVAFASVTNTAKRPLQALQGDGVGMRFEELTGAFRFFGLGTSSGRL